MVVATHSAGPYRLIVQASIEPRKKTAMMKTPTPAGSSALSCSRLPSDFCPSTAPMTIIGIAPPALPRYVAQKAPDDDTVRGRYRE